MSTRPRFRLRYAGIAVASLVLLAIGAAALLLGTATGTRWALGQAIRFVPGELSIADYEGTLLHGLRLSRVTYSYGEIRVDAVQLTLKPDWLRSNRGRIALRQLAAERISYGSTKEREPDPKPLHIAMPALPIDITVAEVATRELQVGERLINNLSASEVRVRGNRIQADRVSGEMSGVMARFERLDTTLSGDVPMRAGVSWRLSDSSWSGEGHVDGTLAELGFEHAVAGTHPAVANGTAYLLRRIQPGVDATVRYDHWQFGEIALSNGVLQVSGMAQAYRIVLDTAVSDAQSRSLTLSGEVSGNTEGLHAIDVVAAMNPGRMSASGVLAWKPAFSANLVMQAQGVDPAQIAGSRHGALDAELRLDAQSGRDFVLQVETLTGDYDQQPVNASGRLTRTPDDWHCTACTVSLGPNRLYFDGQASPDRLNANVRVDAPELALLYPPLAGALRADARLAGSVAQPLFSGAASGSAVRWEDWELAFFSVSSDSSTRDRVDLDLALDGLARGDTVFGSGNLRLVGGREAIDASLQWQFGELRADANAVVALQDGAVTADLRSATLSEPQAGTWQLRAPVELALKGSSISSGPQYWESGDARLNVARFIYDGGPRELDAELVALPLASLHGLLPENVRLAGRADAGLLLTGQEGHRSGSLSWQLSDTVIRVLPPREEPLDIPVPVLSGDFRLDGDAVAGRALLEIEPGVEGSLDLQTDGLSADAALRAQLLFSGSEWEWVSAFFPEIDNIKGTISANGSATGTLAEPQLRGELRWQDGELAIPALNLPLTEIEVTVTGSSAGDASVTGSANAGRGKLTVDGQLEDLLSDQRSFTARLAGRRALLLNWPDYRLNASPDLVVSGDSGGIEVGGKVEVDQATISVRELPEGAVSPSADVSVNGRDEAPRRQLPLRGELELELGENVHLQAFGLDTQLEGDLRFTTTPNREPRAEGKLELVGGKFSAYGQELVIEEGTLTFTGPLDDPIVSVRAVREIDGPEGPVTAGLELRGRAQNVSSSVFARPAMSEADALSYLVIGRPLEQATAADGSMISGTAYALGLRQATTITNQLGQNLGLDQLTVGGSSQSTTELVAGKQVNSRLYVRYAYGVFTEIGNLLLRYRLSDRLTIEAGTGESQSMDLLYLVEKP